MLLMKTEADRDNHHVRLVVVCTRAQQRVQRYLRNFPSILCVSHSGLASPPPGTLPWREVLAASFAMPTACCALMQLPFIPDNYIASSDSFISLFLFLFPVHSPDISGDDDPRAAHDDLTRTRGIEL